MSFAEHSKNLPKYPTSSAGERHPNMVDVGSSTLSWGTKHRSVAQLGEHRFYTAGVAGSNPVWPTKSYLAKLATIRKD
jgi:hypothetical protein